MSRSGLVCAGQNRFEPVKTGLSRFGLVETSQNQFEPV
ncbi:hypothetical protein CP01DC11_1363 [Chlamydia psittaci 01DC11]|nr:hypothetical protein CP01DC11_1363 [Chlamydia psittaci 01DC11]